MSGRHRLRRGIYLLPTLFTVGNLFCGYSSILLAARGEFSRAALLIIIAGVLDGLDGRLARLTGSTSEFGVEFDSLADIVSFGVAPAVLAYHWTLAPFGRLGWLIAFIFVVCAAMRLARFNIRAVRTDKRHFAGLPSPAAAGALACVIFAFPDTNPVGPAWIEVGQVLLVATLALLMISRIRYRSFKELDLRNRRSYVYVLPLAAMVAAIAIHPKLSLLTFAAIYLVSGPASYVWSVRRRIGASSSAAHEAQRETEAIDDRGLR